MKEPGISGIDSYCISLDRWQYNIFINWKTFRWHRFCFISYFRIIMWFTDLKKVITIKVINRQYIVTKLLLHWYYYCTIFLWLPFVQQKYSWQYIPLWRDTIMGNAIKMLIRNMCLVQPLIIVPYFWETSKNLTEIPMVMYVLF